MQARDLFGVIVRTIGVGFIIYGFYDAFFLVARALGLDYGDQYPTEVIVLVTVFFIVLGLAILLSAEGIVRLSYRT